MRINLLNCVENSPGHWGMNTERRRQEPRARNHSPFSISLAGNALDFNERPPRRLSPPQRSCRLVVAEKTFIDSVKNTKLSDIQQEDIHRDHS